MSPSPAIKSSSSSGLTLEQELLHLEQEFEQDKQQNAINDTFCDSPILTQTTFLPNNNSSSRNESGKEEQSCGGGEKTEEEGSNSINLKEAIIPQSSSSENNAGGEFIT
jgi:hypothetical protein